jgi:hypothetical protein
MDLNLTKWGKTARLPKIAKPSKDGGTEFGI